MSDQKTPPAMFEGARVPRDPAPTTAAKPTDRTAALKSTGGGVPAGRLTGFALLPVIAVALIALAASGHVMIALIAGGALLVMVLIGMVSRSASKRRVATRTSVRPDGTVTTTTQPVSRRERNRRQRTRGGPSRCRPRGDGGSPTSRSRSWIPGSDRRSRRSAAHNGPGSPGGRKTHGSRPDGGNPSRPSARQRMRDRMWPNRKDHDSAGRPTGPGGRSAPSDPRSPRSPGSPSSRNWDNRWPRSRNKNSDGSPRSKTPGGSPRSPNDKRPGGNASNPGSPSDARRRPWRSKSNGGRDASGQPKAKTPRSVKDTAPSAPGGAEPSRARSWVKRVVAPAAPSSQREWTGGTGRRVKDKAREKWLNAWADKTTEDKNDPAGTGGATKSRRQRSTRNADSRDQREAAPRDGATDSARRTWWRPRRSAKNAGFAAALNRRWESRGLRDPSTGVDLQGRPYNQNLRPPRRRGGHDAASAASAAFAEDWTPAPHPPAPSRHSAESGLMAEGDWAPSKPSRSAPRSASKGGSSTMSDETSESTAAAGTTQAYDAAQRDARTGSSLAANSASMLRADAARLPNTPRMAPHKAALSIQAGKWSRVSAVYSAIASKLGQSAARHQGGERLQ